MAARSGLACLALVVLVASVADAVSVTRLSPVSGPSRGGTQVTVFAQDVGGSVFTAKCKFGSTLTDPGVTNPNFIVCLSPPADPGTTTTVEISINGGGFSANGRTFAYYAEPALTSISPPSGPTIGGTTITLTGSGFRDIGSDMVVGLGAKVLPARFVSESSITFVTPAASLPAVDLPIEISMNGGADFSVQKKVTYTYYVQPILDRCNPAGGPVSGGTLVTVFGTQFPRPTGSMQYSCEFGRNVVPGTFISENSISCVTPQSEIRGPAPVSISLNGRDYGNEVAFTFFDQPTIFSVTPRGGPVAGGDIVTLKGVGFGDFQGLACKFGSQSAPVQFVDSQTVRCTTPPAVEKLKSTVVPVLLSLNGQDWSGDGRQSSDIAATYRYYPLPSVTGLNPSCGPIGGNTVVQVLGSGFVNTNEDLRVRFGTLDGPATFVSDKQLLAAAPGSQTATPGMAPVSVSMNFFDYRMTGDAPEFHYYTQPEVLSIEPNSGPMEGGSVVTVSGRGIDQQGCALACKFGTAKAVASPLRTGAITCVAPKVAGAQSVPVEISLNDQDFTASKVPFNYYASPQLANVLPRGGPETGNTAVTVRGSGFFPTAALACRFGTASSQYIDVPATYVSPVEVRCLSPAFEVQGSSVVEVRVSENGRDWTPQYLQYMYYDTPSVTALAPNNGPLAGGSPVVVVGSAFMNTGEFLKCKFGDDEVPGKFINATAVLCTSPGAPVRGLAPVEISLNGQDYTANKIPFNYASLQITSVIPSSGPIAGGSLVTVKGFGFQDTGPNRLMCRFANGLSNARFVDRETLLCVTPAYDRGVEEVVPVSATLDGNDWTRNNVQFRYYRQPTVLSYAPAYGPVEGGTIVTVKGSDFEPVPGLSCRFGDQIGAATYISDSVVHCVAPRDVSPQAFSGEPHGVPFGVALNAADFAAGPGAFTFYRNAVPSSISPECGDVRGGTRVTVTSSNLADFGAGALTCSFGSVVVPVAERQTGAVVCVSPPQDKAGEISLVKVALNGRDFVEGPGLAFHYYAVPRLHYLYPNAGPFGAATKVMIAGEFFPAPLLNSSRCFATCKFGSAAPAMALYEASTRLWCGAPTVGNSPTGTVHVSVSFNGQDEAQAATDDAEAFTFYGNPVVTSVSPPSGSVRGGTKVTVAGSGFPTSAASVTCRFGQLAVPGRAISPTSALCVSPASETGSFPLELSFNEKDFTSSGVPFGYYDIAGVVPTSGPVSGGTPVSFLGKGFVPSPDLKCRFGKMDVPAQYVSDQIVACQAPPNGVAGLVLLGVTINGQQFDVAPVAYYYYYQQVAVDVVSPRSGPTTGGALVSLSSPSIAEALGPVARYASFLTPACRLVIAGAPPVDNEARVDSTGAITCVTPRAEQFVNADNNLARLELALNGRDFTTSAREFRLYDVTDVYPKTGTVAASTPITATGYGFTPPTPTTQVRCMINGQSVYADFRDDQHVVCIAPSGGLGFPRRVQIAANGQDYTGMEPEPEPEPEVTPPPPPPQPVVVSTRAIVPDYSSPNVSGLRPDFGPASGSIGVTITGSGFGPTSDGMRCQFGVGKETSGILVDGRTVVCRAPARSGTGKVPVRVSNDAGASWSDNAADFEYYTTPVVESANPTTVSMEAGNTVDVAGAGLSPAGILKARMTPKCRFGEQLSDGSVISDAIFRCTTPWLDEGNHLLSISHNGVDFIGSLPVYAARTGTKYVPLLITFLLFAALLAGAVGYCFWAYWKKNQPPPFIMEPKQTPFRPAPVGPAPSIPTRGSVGGGASSSRRFDFGIMGTVDNRASLLSNQPRSDAPTYYSQNTGMTATTNTEASYRPVSSTFRI